MRNRAKWLAFAVSATVTLMTIYGLELILTVADPAWVDRLGTTLRKRPGVIVETVRLRRRGLHAMPYLQPDTFLDSSSTGLRLSDGSTALPLAGISGALTVLCNESGTTIAYRSDSLGFRNPDTVWERIHPHVVLTGDSFAHGFCRPESETIAGRLRSAGLDAATVGLTGAGPLAELGVMREFIQPVKPKYVFWLFYEGNDLVDLVSERKTILLRYLDPAFSQHLHARARMIQQAERDFADSLLQSHKSPSLASRVWAFLILRNLRTATGLYRSVKQPALADESREVALLQEVLASADRDVRAWGGELRLIYLPERRRFNTKTLPVVGENHDPRVVETSVTGITSALCIPMLNAASEFARRPNPAALWNARRYHYNAEGYEIVANMILAALHSPDPSRGDKCERPLPDRHSSR